MSNEEKQKSLNKKEEIFVSEYLKTFNATEAYLKTHPKSTRQSAWVSASRLLSTAKVSAYVKARINEVHMSADEALKLQADIARGDITEFLTPLGNIDIDLLKKSGKGRLIKKIKQRTITKIGKTDKDEDTETHDTEIELYPADVAQERVLKIHGKMKGDGATVNINMSWKDFIEGKTKESEV